MDRTVFYIALFVLIASAILLISGSSFLMTALYNEPYVPLGNIIAWLGLISLPLSIYYGISAMRYPRSSLEQNLGRMLRIMIIASIIWYPICWLLAGNPSFSFTGSSGIQIGSGFYLNTFWLYNIILVIVPVTCLIVYFIAMIFKTP